jgi:8-oxo-dGTP diphosphatase
MVNVGVFCAITNDKDEILSVKTNYGSKNWTLPGGHLENNESPIHGAIREVFEETGITVEIQNLVSIYSAPDKSDLMLLFKGTMVEEGDFESNEEIEDVKFFHKNALPAQIHPWNIKRINDVFERKTSNFHMFYQ